MAAGSTIGTLFKVTTWGESHGKAIGVVADGCPAGLPYVMQIYMAHPGPEKTGPEQIYHPAVRGRPGGDLIRRI